jgi:hypothetical protein
MPLENDENCMTNNKIRDYIESTTGEFLADCITIDEKVVAAMDIDVEHDVLSITDMEIGENDNGQQ